LELFWSAGLCLAVWGLVIRRRSRHLGAAVPTSLAVLFVGRRLLIVPVTSVSHVSALPASLGQCRDVICLSEREHALPSHKPARQHPRAADSVDPPVAALHFAPWRPTAAQHNSPANTLQPDRATRCRSRNPIDPHSPCATTLKLTPRSRPICSTVLHASIAQPHLPLDIDDSASQAPSPPSTRTTADSALSMSFVGSFSSASHASSRVCACSPGLARLPR
jgi:hypothetical protein